MQNKFFLDEHEISLRPATSEDWDFQYSIYVDTRSDEMELVDWSDQQKSAFLHQQFDAQKTHYKNYYPDAITKIIFLDGCPIGRIILFYSKDFILIIDIALIFKYRNIGIGSILIKDLLEEATSSNLSVVLRVEIFNPAIRLYQLLGFQKTRLLEVYQEMVWTPSHLNSKEMCS